MNTAWLRIDTLAALAAGTGLGWAYFTALRRGADALVHGRMGPIGAMGWRLARTAGLAVGLVVAARMGAAVLLAAAFGVMLGRALVLRAARPRTP